MKLCKFLVAFLLISDAGYGATLNELQQTALENREIIAKYKINLEKSAENQTIAKSGYYPSLDFSYSMNWLDEGSTFESDYSTVFSGAVTWNLFTGFRDKYNIRSADLLRKAEAFKLKGIEQDVMLNVALRYLSIYNRQANLQVAEDSYRNLFKAYEDSQNRYEVGLIKKNEVLKFKVDLNNAIIIKKRAGAELKKSVQLLQREIDADIELDQLTFTELDPLPVLGDRREIEPYMLENRSDIKVLEMMELAAEMQIKAEKALHYPRVDLTSSYRKRNDDLSSSSFDIDDEEVRVLLVFTINLFDGFEKKSRVNRARLETRTIRHDITEIKRDLTTQLQNLFLDYEVSADNVEVAQGNIEQAEENLRITRLSYKEGIETESDLLDAIANLSLVKHSYVTAKSNVFDTLFRITRAVEGF